MSVQTASLAPGVYYQVVDATAPIGAGVRTDIAAFVGIAERGPLDTPVPVESWRQFVARFGGCIGGGYLAYVVRAFFENEGRRCWVVRVASRDPHGGARSASATLAARAAGPAPWRIAASSPGAWGNGLRVRVAETRRAQTTARAVAGDPTVLSVASVAGFERGTLARIIEPGVAPRYRVVSGVDAIAGRLVWVDPRPERRLRYDEPLALDATRTVEVESVEYSVAVTLRGVPIGVWSRVTPIPEHPAYGPRILPGDAAALTRDEEAGSVDGVPAPPAPIAIEELRPEFLGDAVTRRVPVRIGEVHVAAAADLLLAGGTEGLALLRAGDFLGEPFAAEDPPAVRALRRRGLRALGDVDEVAIVAVPDVQIRAERVPAHAPECVPDPCLTDAPPPPPPQPPPELPPVFSAADVYRVQAALVDDCAERRRIALLDAPYTVATDARLGVAALRAWRARFDSNFAAIYHPWLEVVDPLRRPASPTRAIPPCGHVAGQMARTDLATGVHQSPANAPLGWAEDVTTLVDDATHGLLNDEGINVVRPLPGRGIRILGARLATSDPSWRYVSVRRLVLMIMKAIGLATQWAVFEPNDEPTRSKIRLALIVYLTTLWRRGALAGRSAEAGFFVKCDAENNPPELRDNGQLLAVVGVAPTTPWEFIVLRVWRAGNELEIAGAAAAPGGGF